MLTTLMLLGALAGTDCPLESRDKATGVMLPIDDAAPALAVVFRDRVFRCPAFRRTTATQETVTQLRDIRPEEIQSINVLKGERAVELFGEWATEGAIFFILKADARK